MTAIRRLDHVAIVVRSTRDALRDFEQRLGLKAVHAEEIERPHVLLTYLDCGNIYLQLVEPLEEDGDLALWLRDHGEGMHHLCFGVDDPIQSATDIAVSGSAPHAGSGRGRVSAFVPGPPCHGVRIECTQFDFGEDVSDSPGWLPRDLTSDSMTPR